MRFRHMLALIGSFAIAFAALPAQAAVQVTAYSYSPPPIGGTIDLKNPLTTPFWGGAGRFLSTIQDLVTLNSFQQYTFCLDVLHGYSTYAAYSDVSLASFISNVTKQNQLAGLLSHANGIIDGAANQATASLDAAAFGLAIWEVLYETSGTLDLTGGNFSAYGDFVPAATLANSYLANVQSNAWTGNVANVRVLSSVTGRSQNQIYITSGAVPEPSTWALLMAGFGMIGAALRRRRKPVMLAA